MNYRHSYHAGNFADVFKHIVLVALLKSFLKKDNSFCYLETHAGAGVYDLNSESAQKTKEFESGIGKIISPSLRGCEAAAAIQNAGYVNEVVNDYLSCIKKINTDASKNYPGSPYFAKYFLRQNDRAILAELHEEEYAALKKFFARDKQIAVHHQDGYLALKAFLPPKEKRGLILIDPPYEQHDEFETLTKILPHAVQRFETGVFALWYPIKDRQSTDRFLKNLQAKISRPVLISELIIHPNYLPSHLNGSGMLIVNPPWQIEDKINEITSWLATSLRAR
jgi:23S rRNA (adenine2030-N6)-methyltransferase